MSDVPQGPGWWQASDGRWYPPEAFPGAQPQQPPATPPGQPYADQVYQGGQLAPGGPFQGAPKNDGMSVAALVTGIASIPMLCFCGLGLVGGIVAVVLGIMGRKNVRESNGALTGDGMALAGAICGGVAVLLGVLYMVFWGLSFAATDWSTSGY